MAQFGTIELYEELAVALNSDPQWPEISRDLTYSMVFVFESPIDRQFFVRFEQGRMIDVHQLDSPESEPADFVFSAAPEVWRAILDRKVKPTRAIAMGKLHLKGSLGALMKHMKAFGHLLDLMTAVEVV